MNDLNNLLVLDYEDESDKISICSSCSTNEQEYYDSECSDSDFDDDICPHCGCDTENNTPLINNLKNIDIKIIKENKEKKVRITLDLSVISNNKNELVSIDFDIDKNIYLNIAKQLSN
jgi:hypothetical protein